MEKIIRLSLVLGLGLITSLSYGQTEKKEETAAPAKKTVELKENQLPKMKVIEPTPAPKEAQKPVSTEKKYEESKEPMQKVAEKENTQTNSEKENTTWFGMVLMIPVNKWLPEFIIMFWRQMSP